MILAKPDMNQYGALERQLLFYKSGGYLLVADGPGTYIFDLYTNSQDGAEQDNVVGTARVKVGECSSGSYLDDYTVLVDWFLTGSNGVCLSRDTTYLNTHAHYMKPKASYGSFSARCCKVDQPCYIYLDTKVEKSWCDADCVVKANPPKVWRD